MALTSGLSPNVVKTALDKVFYGEFDYPTMPGMATARSQAFIQDTAENQAVIVKQFSVPGYFDERSERQNIAEKTPLVGNQKTFSINNFAQSVNIPKRFFDDEQHSVVERLVNRMGRNGRLSQDKNAFNRYNLGFTTELSNDGVALFSNSHTTLSGDTVDNLETGALSPSKLDAAVVSRAEQLTQDGTLGGFEPYCLLVPPALFKEAQEITKSELASGTADNDMNYFSQVYPGLMVKQSPFLGASQGGSDTAWFLMSRNHSMYRWERQGIVTDVVDYKFSSANEYVYKAEYRETTGSISYEGMVGSTGAA